MGNQSAMDWWSFGRQVGIRFGVIMAIFWTFAVDWRFGLCAGILSGLFFGASVSSFLYWLFCRKAQRAAGGSPGG